MYLFVLGLHNVLRWLVLMGAVYLLARLLPGLGRRRPWTRAQSVAASIYTGFMYLQLLVGLALYIGAPYMRSILGNFGAALKGGETRFFAVEHVSGMLLAVLWFGLSLLCVLALIPWWRPLLRL